MFVYAIAELNIGTSKWFSLKASLKVTHSYFFYLLSSLSGAKHIHNPKFASFHCHFIRFSNRSNLTFKFSKIHFPLQESISTCRFAQRVAMIKNDAILNEEVDPKLVRTEPGSAKL